MLTKKITAIKYNCHNDNDDDVVRVTKLGCVECLTITYVRNSRPHRMYAAHRCGLLLQTSHVAGSVCLCLSVCWVLATRVSCA